jgi:SAM-dependent methyltransferase
MASTATRSISSGRRVPHQGAAARAAASVTWTSSRNGAVRPCSILAAAVSEQRHRSVDYYRKALPMPLWRRLLRRQQQRIYDRFARHFPPTPALRVVDIGVNGAHQRRELHLLESRWPYPASIVACGLEPPDNFTRCVPEARYVQAARGAPLPFADREFDVAFCSAVIEHVGDRAAQRRFLADVLRVARGAFVTTPNRWYPVELHTLVPVVHYLPAPVYRRVYRALGFDFFAREENLNLLDRAALRALVPPGRTVAIETASFLGLPSNLLLVARD